MPRYRYRNPFVQAVFPIKTLAFRFSIFILAFIAVLILIFSKIDNEFIKHARSRVTDLSSLGLNVVTSPFHAALNVKDAVANYFNVYDENRRLREENQRLTKLQSYSSVIAIENRQLKKLLNYAPEPGTTFISSRVIGEVGGPFVRSAIINLGDNDGAYKGQIVVNEEGVVGRVIEVGKISSRILLVTDINSRIPVVSGQSRELGILTGNNSEMLKMLYFPDDTKMKPGEEIYTSGDGEIFPPGLLIGYIHSVENNKILVRSAVNWNRLEHVAIVKYNNSGLSQGVE